MKIDKSRAAALFREEAAAAETTTPDPAWVSKIERLSQLCEDGISKTHIAFLGTAILAMGVDARVDLYAIKPKLAPTNPYAYSARSLCHAVVVPLAAELGISIGVTGREPLNNQPYFRIKRLGDDTPVHAGGRAAFAYMIELVSELSSLATEAEAREALRAFIAVRRKYQPRYLAHEGETALTPERLVAAIKALVRDDSEGGKRAQAVVAGLMDVFAGVERVESGRVNDPSRQHPGDVCVRSAVELDQWDKAIEVRDKPVTASDVQIFAKKCLSMGTREAAVVMVADDQARLDPDTLGAWAASFGLGLTVFRGWDSFVDQALFWADLSKPEAAAKAVGFIHERLRAVEASPEAVALWEQLTGA